MSNLDGNFEFEAIPFSITTLTFSKAFGMYQHGVTASARDLRMPNCPSWNELGCVYAFACRPDICMHRQKKCTKYVAKIGFVDLVI